MKKFEVKASSLGYPLLGDIAPEDHPRPENVIERRSGLRVVHYRSHFTMVERDFPDVMATGEQKRGMSLGGFALRVVSWISKVTGHALALQEEMKLR